MTTVEADRVQHPGGPEFRADLEGRGYIPYSKIEIGAEGAFDGPVSASNPLPTVNVVPALVGGPGISIYTDSIHKFGANPVINTATVPEAIWAVGGPITWPTAAATASVVSDNDADASAGTGTQTLYLQGVDASFAKVDDTITMTGQTPAVTTQEFLFVDRMYSITPGSNGTNVGNITATIGGTTSAYIAAGDGQTLQAVFVVPDITDKTGYFVNAWSGIGKSAQSAYVRMQLCQQPDGGSRRVMDDIVVPTEAGIVPIEIKAPFSLAPGTRVWWECIESSSNGVLSFAGFEMVWV